MQSGAVRGLEMASSPHGLLESHRETCQCVVAGRGGLSLPVLDHSEGVAVSAAILDAAAHCHGHEGHPPEQECQWPHSRS